MVHNIHVCFFKEGIGNHKYNTNDSCDNNVFHADNVALEMKTLSKCQISVGAQLHFYLLWKQV